MLTSAIRRLEELAQRQTVLPHDPAGSVQLRRRALYILPTREGLYYGAMLAVMLIAAMNYANGLAYALTFMLAAIGVVGMLHTHRNLVGLRLSAGPAPPVFAGEAAIFTIVLHNDGTIERRAVDVSLAGQTRRVDVPAQGTAVLALAVPTTERGYLVAPPVRLRTRFPLGLWCTWSRPLGVPARCLVYPRPAPPQPLPVAPVSLSGQDHGRRTEGEDFAGLREFRPGDPMQRVAWKKVAAGQGWHTKQFTAPSGQLVWLEWDMLMARPVEARLSLLCRWVLTAEQQQCAYGLRLPGTTLAPATGPTHRARCLERLALFGQSV